jgi:hypothetical protein
VSQQELIGSPAAFPTYLHHTFDHSMLEQDNPTLGGEGLKVNVSAMALISAFPSLL